MSVTPASFRAVFPEFGDTTKYADPAVAFWLAQAGVTLPQSIPPGQIDLATMLFAAHNLTLSYLSVVNGGSGSALAPVASKSVGPISKSLDTASVSYAGAGVYNGSAYGQRLWALLKGLTVGGFYRPSVRAARVGAMANYPYGR